jgi:hypothetical protein
MSWVFETGESWLFHIIGNAQSHCCLHTNEKSSDKVPNKKNFLQVLECNHFHYRILEIGCFFQQRTYGALVGYASGSKY